MEEIDVFETYAPVVQWTTVQLMLILEVLLGLKSNQGDVTTEFIHADIPEYEKVYVEIPRLFEQFSNNGHTKCLQLENMLYGLRHIPCDFWKQMKNKLEQSGLNQSRLNPCIFVSDKVTCIVYVDNIIF